MKKKYLSDLVLEQYILKELPEKRILEIDGLLKHNADLKRRLKEIETSNIQILRKYPKDIITTDIERRYAVKKTRNWLCLKIFHGKNNTGSKPAPIRKFMFPSIILAAAAIAFIFILPGIKQSFNVVTINDLPEVTNIKGSTAIYLYRKTGNNIEILQNGSTAKKGDLLQITYVSIKDIFGVILSIDSRGIVTLHHPPNKTASAKLITGKKVLLSNSYELDDAPDYEQFFLITSKSMLNVNAMLNAAEALARDKAKALHDKIDMDASTNQISIAIKKEK